MTARAPVTMTQVGQDFRGWLQMGDVLDMHFIHMGLWMLRGWLQLGGVSRLPVKVGAFRGITAYYAVNVLTSLCPVVPAPTLC